MTAPPKLLADDHDALIRDLAAGLAPVRRLRPPVWRAAGWLGAVLVLAVALGTTADLGAVARRLAAAPDMWLAVVGAAATAVLAALAAFELSLPGGRSGWIALPLPGLALWLGASGVGCLRGLLPQAHVAVLAETADCTRFILGVSLPLSALMIVMLRRTRPLRPGPVAAMGGLAAAAAAAAMLTLVHPFDAGALDLGVHAAVVALVVLLVRGAGGRVLARAG